MDARLKLAAVALVLALGCGDKKAETAAEVEDTPAPAVVAPEPTPTAPVSTAASLLQWLDPDAIAVAWVALPPDLDVDTFATVFAMPPKAAQLVQDVAGIDAALDAVLPEGRAQSSTWFGPESLAMSTRFGVGTYVLRRLVVPRATVQTALLGVRMREQEVDGFTMLVPEGPLPFRVVFLGDDVIGFVPAREIGSGLGPLTAGRDLPAGETERELGKVLEEAPDAPLELYAAGPLLHFDLGEDIVQFAVRARKWQGGLDVQTRLAPDGDAAAAATTLEARDVSLETGAVRALCERVAFTVDQNFVEGRLQLTREDMTTLRVTE
jgi:hypothetical protein